MTKGDKTPQNITTVYNHATSYKLDLYIDAQIVGFVDYKIKNELLKKNLYKSNINRCILSEKWFGHIFNRVFKKRV